MTESDIRQMEAPKESKQTVAQRAPEVLIVGAGPAGLMTAIQLLRNGVYPTLIDQNPGPEHHVGVSFLQARSLEMLDQLGLAETLIGKGEKLSRLALIGGEQALDLEKLPASLTQFPFVLVIPTRQLVRVLLDYLTTQAFKIKWNTQLQKLLEKDDGVVVTIGRSSSPAVIKEGTLADAAETAAETWICDWVIGADGANSTVRKDLGISVDRKEFSQQYFQVEMTPESTPEHLPEEPLRMEEARVWIHQRQILSAFPIGGGHRFLLFGSRPSQKTRPDALLAYLGRTFARYTSGVRLRPVPPTLITQPMMRAIAQHFGGRRTFLVGDAAHLHLPLTQQGVDAGFMDGWNLGWKLAGVVQGRLDRKVLQTYHTERLPQTRRDAGIQGRSTNISWPATILRIQKTTPFLLQRVISTLLRQWQNKPSLLARLYSKHAGLDAHHRDSALSAHYSRSEMIRSGDRFPWIPLFDEKKKEWTHTHEVFKKTGFTLVVMGPVSHHTLHVLGQWIKQKYPQGMNLFYIPYSQTNHALFEQFGMDAHTVQLSLVRPDMHITYLTNALHTPLIDDFLSVNLGWKLYRQFD